jgi:hypothetical protein
MPTYTFIKDKHECGNIEGCKFNGDAFITSDEDEAERLRKSYTFNKTIHEIKEESKPSEPDTLDTCSYADLSSLCKERGIPANGRGTVLKKRLREWESERK